MLEHCSVPVNYRPVPKQGGELFCPVCVQTIAKLQPAPGCVVAFSQDGAVVSGGSITIQV